MPRIKIPRRTASQPAEGPSLKPPNTAFKIKLRGKDGAPLTMAELRQGLFDIAHRLAPYADFRAKWVTVYLTLVDENGQEVRINRKGEWTLYPYKSAADEHGA
jgi:hypothetical protein